MQLLHVCDVGKNSEGFAENLLQAKKVGVKKKEGGRWEWAHRLKMSVVGVTEYSAALCCTQYLIQIWRSVCCVCERESRERV